MLHTRSSSKYLRLTIKILSDSRFFPVYSYEESMRTKSGSWNESKFDFYKNDCPSFQLFSLLENSEKYFRIALKNFSMIGTILFPENIRLTTVSYNWSMISFKAVFNWLSKISLWPIPKKTDNPTNQSKFKVITCSGLEARENVCQRVTVGLGFTSDWTKKVARVF